MTTLWRYQGMDAILTGLWSVRSRYLSVQLFRGLAGLTAAACGGLVLAALVGYWPGQPPALLRWAMLAGLAALWSAAATLMILAVRRGRLNHAQTARLIEQRLGGLDNGLINAIQLSTDAMQTSAPLVQKAIRETAAKAAKAPLADAVSTQSLKRWTVAAAMAMAALAAMAIFQGPRTARGLSAVFNPAGFARRLGSVTLLSLQPTDGDTTLFAGERLTIVAEIDSPSRRRLGAYVEIAAAGRRGMVASPDGGKYTCALGKVEQSFQYAIHVGDSTFPSDRPYYKVTVLQRVRVEGLDLHYRFPKYLDRDGAIVTNAAGPVEAPLGTTVKATVRLSAPVPAARLILRSGRTIPMAPADGAGGFSAEFDVTADGGYRIVLADRTGRPLQQLPDPATSGDTAGWYSVRAIPDRAPKITFIEPAGDVSVAPGGKLAMRIRASDDHALAGVRLFLGPEGSQAKMIHEFAGVADKAAVELNHAIEMGPDRREGDVLVFYATAIDGRSLGALGGPQTTTSARYKITVQDAVKVAAERAKRYEQLRRRLLAILAAQESQRVNTSIAAGKLSELAAVRGTGKTIAAGQQAIKADILDLVDKFPFEPEMLTVQQALALLGNNEAAIAVSQARVLAGLGDLAGRGRACRVLGESQDKIIRAIQTLLAILPSLQSPEAARKTAAGDDLPPDARAKLSALKADLEKFIEEQRKIIEASKRLTKRPVDEFTPEDQKLLQELQLAQDKWEKFLNEAFADFSKLAQQDFSKPSLLKELISVKTDVTMAKDALAKKATEIATALEDNGVENAESLTANIEKWLPDEPDRIKWNMEDTADQANIEQAELPDQLEDLVGDLLEAEEDLFEEMDDITAKSTMSGDKGIGWDAMDGPISSMNAQGVTGNQLPNTSEIGGRSGEGRTGKSTGEFVEDKAVGKGGRRTPTRLTPEPFQTGQISDSSGDSGGGATGGGKVSGAGGEGLEGPVPKALQQRLKRLAGRQAQLRNRAERIQARFKVSDYSNYQFLQAITLMNQVQHDLANYRYRNALRARRVTIGALRRTHLLLTGKIDVTTDATANMPKYVKDDIADARKAKLPAEYRDVLTEYFRRLAEGEK